ncbi:GNAT family N-acetyltransferase [Actinoplanes cyaneus]|uniref:GNAT family N-acetyltransferase n=1 Tax=Actinoplanes cyaneus TaxID=52696 RepID=UPI0019435988|nr:GNAT family N-acetyltransferase [Actinoplanes cyaneus]
MNSAKYVVDSVDDLAPQLANNRAYWLGWGSTSAVDDDLPIYRSDLRHGMLNGVLRARGIDLATAVSRAREALAGTSWMWWYHPLDSDVAVADLLVHRGATLAGTVPLMAARLDDVPEVPVPSGVRLEPARTNGDLAAFARTYLVPNGMTMTDADAAAQVEISRDGRLDDQLRYVAWFGDEPVACGALSISHGVAGIYNMATIAAFEGRGIGTALAVELLTQARRRGLKVATLTASPRGALVYRRLGFDAVSEYRLFSF